MNWIAPMLTIPLLTLLALMGLSYLLSAARQRDSRHRTKIMSAQMEHTLTLIQNLQKHRGLGVQQSAAAQRQREQVIAQVESEWKALMQSMEGLPHALTYLYAGTGNARQRWASLRAEPADFDGHCGLIDQLLTILALLERASIKTASPVIALSVTTRCRDVEDLARLRGLAARAGGAERCPIYLEVPLRFLCQRVAAAGQTLPDAAVNLALKEIQQKLLDSVRVQITSARCFELLTPSIDRRLDELRQSFHAQGTVGLERASVVRAPVRATSLAVQS